MITPEMCQETEHMIMEDWRLKVSTIAPECSLTEPSILAILHDCRGMSKARFCWVPRKRTPLSKLCRIQFSEENFGIYEADPETVLSRIIARDEKGGPSLGS